MSMVNTANGIQANLAQVLFDGQKAVTDQAMRQVQANMQVKATLQQQQTTMATVAMMTGIGTKVDTVV